MSALPTPIEADASRLPTSSDIFALTAARETSLSRLLTVYITTGLIFMLLPGTLLGVWNRLAISSQRAANSDSAGWIQAHGHAQIFGWIGTFILGIGFYSIPKLRRTGPLALSAGWIAWVLWTSGVSMRWLASMYEWHWRAALPVSATLELSAFLIFFRSVSGHRPQDSGKNHLEEWVMVVIAGTVGLLITLVVNLASAVSLTLYGRSPDLPHSFDQRFLVLQTWGFLVPYQVHVRGPVVARHRMSSSRGLRNPGLSGCRSVGVVVASGFCGNRDGCGHGFCGEPADDVRTAAELYAGISVETLVRRGGPDWGTARFPGCVIRV